MLTFALKIRESLRVNIVPYQADVYLRVLRLQLFIDLHSPLDGQLVHNNLLLQHLIITPIIQDIFLNCLLRVVHFSFMTHSALLFVTTVQLRNAVLLLL